MSNTTAPEEKQISIWQAIKRPIVAASNMLTYTMETGEYLARSARNEAALFERGLMIEGEVALAKLNDQAKAQNVKLPDFTFSKND